MKVLLVNAPPKVKQDTSGFEFLYPPLGVLYLASYARKVLDNTDFKFADGLLLGPDRTLDVVKQFRPDIVGVSYTTSACEGAYSFIEKVKSFSKGILVVSGGPHASVFFNEVMGRSKTDICVLGEGELTFAEILQGNLLKDIDGIVYQEGDKTVKTPNRKSIRNLDDIPFPARDLVEDWSVYKGFYLTKTKPDMTITSSRGCPYNCNFCSNPVWKLSKPVFRARSPENVVAELRELKSKYGVKEIYDQTDDFNLSKKHALDLSQTIIDADLGLSFKFQARANTMDEKLAENIKKMGTWLVFIGAESGNQRTLDGVKKKIKVEDIENCAKLLSTRGVKVYGLFMGFNIWEEEGKLCFEGVDECRNTIKFSKHLVKKGYMHFMGFSLLTPFPGTEVFEIATRHNLFEKTEGWMRWNDLWKLNIKLPGVSDKDWHIVKGEAARAQAWCVLRSGNLNFKAINPLFRRAIQMVKFQLEKLWPF